MGGELRNLKVSDVAAPTRNALVGGPFGSNLVSRDYVDTGVPVIRGQNMGERWISGEFAFVSEEKAESLASNLAHPRDIIFTQRGTLGQVSMVPQEPYQKYLVSQSQMKLTVNTEMADPLFLYYVFCSPGQQEYIRQNTTQSGVPHTNLGTLRETPIALPQLREQRAIADILGTLDDKIELNCQMNRTLEAMARAIFKAWFVDFEPVTAKAAGATSFRGMPQAVFDQLPDRFIDTELGLVPEGWEVKPLGDVLDVTMGQSPPSEYYNEDGDGLPFHQGVRDYGFRYPVHRVSCTLESRVADEGDVLLSVRAPVGRINVADRRMVIGRGLAAAKHRDGHSSYALYSLKHLFAIEDAVGDGTIYKAITKRFLLGMPVVSPPRDIVGECEKLLKPLDSLVEVNEKASQTLAAIRDALLPKLISGELRVPVAEGGPDGG